MLALSLSDKFCCFGIFVFVFNRFLFSRFSFVLVLVSVNEFVILLFFIIFVFVTENLTVHWLPINYPTDYKVASLVYKVRSTGSPAYLQVLVSDYVY